MSGAEAYPQMAIMNVMPSRSDRSRLDLMRPVALRLGEAANSPELIQRIEALGSRIDAAPARTILQTQEEPVHRPRFLLSGWACRYRHLTDGRRQIFDLVVPGDGVGVCLRPSPLAKANTVALTSVQLVNAGPLLGEEAFRACPELLTAVQAQADADEHRAMNQIMRLGRLTAVERIGHLLLELRDRLHVVGKVEADSFAFPLTQETLADMSGLSVVHVNRTLQELRRRKLVWVERGRVALNDLQALAQLADYELH